MPDDMPSVPPAVPDPVPDAAPDVIPVTEANPGLDLGPGPGINIAEEFGTAKRNLPPAKIVGIVLAVAVVVLAESLRLWNAPSRKAEARWTTSPAVEIPNQSSVLVAVNVTVHNSGEKTLWIHDIKGVLKTDSGEFTDEAASPVDFARYFEAFPALKEHALEAIPPETKIAPGGQDPGHRRGELPGNPGRFDKRKSLSVVIQPYDQPLPLVLTK